jgi:integrase
MGIYKRGGVYWYKFQWKGVMVRESSKQGNDKVARQMEAAHRTSLAKGEVGIREKKVVPLFVEFCEKRFQPWIESTTSAKTWLDFYRVGLRAIKSYHPISGLRLNEITSEVAVGFAGYRQGQGLQVSTVNSSLRALRRVLRIASEWGEIGTVPRIKMLPGERHRERVVTPEEQGRYLAAAREPLVSIGAVLIDTGLRPEECYRLVWESITWSNGRNGTLLVTHGKTKAARRVIPMTPQVREVLEKRWESAGKPPEGWVWPAPTRSGHVEPSSLKKQHRKTLGIAGVRQFVLYSLRHTFLTRLGESGCDVWTLARIAGHSSITISARYVHPSENAVLSAVEKLGGHNSGHSRKQPALAVIKEKQLTA